MNINDKVHVDPAVLIGVLEKRGECFGKITVDASHIDGALVITTDTDIDGQVLCERGDDPREMREVKYDFHNTPLLIPRERQQIRLDWETLYPRAHWPIYALAAYETCHYSDFVQNLALHRVRVGLVKNTYEIIDVSDSDMETAKATYAQVRVTNGRAIMYGVSAGANLVAARARLVAARATTEMIKPLFICIYRG